MGARGGGGIVALMGGGPGERGCVVGDLGGVREGAARVWEAKRAPSSFRVLASVLWR